MSRPPTLESQRFPEEQHGTDGTVSSVAFGVAIEDEGNGADLWEARNGGAQGRSGTSQTLTACVSPREVRKNAADQKLADFDPWESLEPLDPVLGGRFCRDSKP